MTFGIRNRQTGAPVERIDGSPVPFEFEYQAETFLRQYFSIHTHEVFVLDLAVAS